MRKRKLYHELTFADDFMFWKVMETHLDLGKEILELLLGRPLEDIRIAQRQKNCKVSYDSRGIRLDVFVMDDSSRLYDVEMQSTPETNLPKRMRYYGDVIDITDIQVGAAFKDLKETFIIFICMNDPFERGLPIYEFSTRCIQNLTIPYEDGLHKIVVNAACKSKEISKDLQEFFAFLRSGKGTNTLTRRLEEAVADAITRDDWRVEYMKFEIMLQKEREEGRQEGADLLAEVILRLRNGENKESIIASGVDKQLVELAETLI